MSAGGSAAHAQVSSLPSAGSYDSGTSHGSRNTGFGIKGGLSWGNLQVGGSPLFSSSFEDLKTFHAGLYGQYGFTQFASVQAELLYARKGFQDRDPQRVPDVVSNRLDYLALPLLFVANIAENLSLHLGPQIAVLTSARRGTQALDLGRSGYRRADFGGVVGGEARIGPVRLGARYELGFTDLNPSGAALAATGQPVQVVGGGNHLRNQVVQVYLGLGVAR